MYKYFVRTFSIPTFFLSSLSLSFPAYPLSFVLSIFLKKLFLIFFLFSHFLYFYSFFLSFFPLSIFFALLLSLFLSSYFYFILLSFRYSVYMAVFPLLQIFLIMCGSWTEFRKFHTKVCQFIFREKYLYFEEYLCR